MFRIEAGCFQHSLDRGISRMDLSAEPADATLFCIVKQCRDQSCANSFVAPRLLDEQLDKIHRFAAKLRAPSVRRVRISADTSLMFGDKNESGVAFNDMLENRASTLAAASLGEKLLSKFAKTVDILRCSGSNIEWTARCLHPFVL